MSNYDPETNSVTLEVLETQFANDNRPQYMVGIKCAPNVTGTVLVITDLQKIPQDINTFPTSDDWYSGYVPTAFSLELGAGQKIVPVDENKTYTVVYNPADGYYHFNSVDGPVVYVNLDYSRLSFKNMINPGGSTGTSFKRYWIEDGLCVRKENYTDLMTQYLLSACEITSGDTTYLLYPMTKDLQYMVEVGGERWWNIEYNNGAEYIFLDEDGNPEEVALTPGWLFAACYTE